MPASADPVRGFVAVPCPPLLRAELTIAPWRSQAGVRWTAPAQAHLTLRFLGTATAEGLAALDTALRVAASLCRTLVLRPGATGAFPGWRRPRVLWLGIEAEETRSLERLAAAVEAGARVAGFPSEERPFTPHLTLGRVTDRRALDDAVPVVRSWRADSGPEPACEVVLYRSDLGSSGAHHTALARYPLATEETR